MRPSEYSITSAAWQVRNILKTPRKPIRFDEPWGTAAASALTSDVSTIRSAALSHAVPVKHVRCGPTAPPQWLRRTSHSGSYGCVRSMVAVVCAEQR